MVSWARTAVVATLISAGACTGIQDGDKEKPRSDVLSIQSCASEAQETEITGVQINTPEDLISLATCLAERLGPDVSRLFTRAVPADIHTSEDGRGYWVEPRESYTTSESILVAIIGRDSDLAPRRHINEISDPIRTAGGVVIRGDQYTSVVISGNSLTPLTQVLALTHRLMHAVEPEPTSREECIEQEIRIISTLGDSVRHADSRYERWITENTRRISVFERDGVFGYSIDPAGLTRVPRTEDTMSRDPESARLFDEMLHIALLRSAIDQLPNTEAIATMPALAKQFCRED
jgi:hypothetical protein